MEIIVDLHGTSETEQDARNKATALRWAPGKTVKITKVELRPQTHAATVTYELESDPNFDLIDYLRKNSDYEL